jgi:P-type E1-E2 ATPase
MYTHKHTCTHINTHKHTCTHKNTHVYIHTYAFRCSNREVVVGDILVLSTGDIIVADGLVFERNTLKIFEGALTGESNAISKGKDSESELYL